MERWVRRISGIAAVAGLIWIVVLLGSKSPLPVEGYLEFGEPESLADKCPAVLHDPQGPYEKNTCSQVGGNRLAIALLSAIPTTVAASVAVLYRRRDPHN